LKFLKVAIEPVVLRHTADEGGHVSRPVEEIVKEAEGLVRKE